ncbi:MAG TPA: metallophosphoesterase [Gemmatimonadaceae bacterium]|nr:metallophosphoesterase [Gemmatimonadaceae bacterium]
METIHLRTDHGSTALRPWLTRAVRGVAITLCCGLVPALSACRHQISLQSFPESDIETTLFFVGDAGEQDPRVVGAPLDSLTAQASVAPERTVIVFLGDNVYPAGIPAEGAAEWADARRRLEAQVRAIPPGVRGIFLPGNHDWSDSGPFGLYSMRLEERMIATLAQGRNIRLLPTNGCPGPVPVDIGRLRLIALDSQWWLHTFIVKDSLSTCANSTPVTVTAALREEVRPPGAGRIVFVAAHHPLMTGGPHGGYCGITGPFRRFSGGNQDIMSAGNRTFRDSVRSAFRGRPPLAYIAGHDHNLQVLRGGGDVDYILVSGAGSESKTECAVRLRESYYTSQHRTGFMRIDVMKTKGVLLRVFRYPSTNGRALVYSRWLERQ